MLHFVTEDYNLSFQKKSRPDMSFEDLRCVLRHHWIDDQEIYPTERQRIKLSFMLLLWVYTVSRPGAILQTGCANGTNRALRYRDVELMLLANPTPGGRDLWVMKIMFVFLKGDHRSSNPWILTYLPSKYSINNNFIGKLAESFSRRPKSICPEHSSHAKRIISSPQLSRYRHASH